MGESENNFYSDNRKGDGYSIEAELKDLNILELYDINDEYDKVVLFLHGVGGKGSEWVNFWKKILPSKTKLILPTAPKANVTMFGEARLNSWYNMYNSNSSNLSEVVRIMSHRLCKIIQKEIEKGINKKKIFIGGFSQGAALALYTSLFSPVDLGGTIVLSGFLLASWELTAASTDLMNKSCPILLCHGVNDEKIPMSYCQYCYDILSQFYYDVKLKKYPGLGHEVNTALQHDLQLFLSIINDSPES